MHSCGCSTSLHEKCNKAEAADFQHFFRCPTIEESRKSEQKCRRCRRAQAGTVSATLDPKAKTKNRYPYGWNIRNFIPRKQKKGEEQGNGKLDLVVVKVPQQCRSVYAPLSPKIVQQTPHVVQPTSTNPHVAAHPLRENVPLGVHPLRQYQIQRKPVTVISSSDELFYDDRPSTATAAAKTAKETEQILSNLHHHQSTAAAKSSELSEPASRADWDAQQTLNREARKPHPRPFIELFPDEQNYTPYHPLIDTEGSAETQRRRPGPSSVTALIPELQNHAQNCPPIDTDKLAGYLKEIATRFRAYPPYQPSHIEDDEPTFFEHQPQRHTTVRHATVAALQQAELALSLERNVEGIPSCLIPGLKKELTKTPQTLRRKKSSNSMTFAQAPAHFEFREAQKQELSQKREIQKPAYQADRPKEVSPIPPPPQTAAQVLAPFDLGPKLEKVSPAPSPIALHREGSRAGPGWEVFKPLTPPTAAPLVIRKKKSPQGALNASAMIRLKVSADALVPRAAPRIPSLQKIPSLQFDGTLLEGVVRSVRPQGQRWSRLRG